MFDFEALGGDRRFYVVEDLSPIRVTESKGKQNKQNLLLSSRKKFSLAMSVDGGVCRESHEQKRSYGIY